MPRPWAFVSLPGRKECSMTCCAHKIIVASIPSRILPLPPGFTHFPTIPAPTGFERPFERRDHGKVENPPPPRIPLRGESGSKKHVAMCYDAQAAQRSPHLRRCPNGRSLIHTWGAPFLLLRSEAHALAFLPAFPT